MSDINNLNGEELVLVASLVSIIISQGKTTSELNALALFFSSVSTNIATIAATRSPSLSEATQAETELLLGL